MAMREVKRLFEDYKENIRAIKRYEEHNIREEMVKVRVSKFKNEKVQGGTVTKEDTVMARRIDIANANSNAIKQIKKRYSGYRFVEQLLFVVVFSL